MASAKITAHQMSTSPQSAASEGDEGEKSLLSRIRIQTTTAAKLRDFGKTHNISNDDAITGLIDSYDRITQYRYSAEAGHLIAELRKLDSDILVLASLNMQLMELARSLQQSDYQVIAQALELNATRA
jgi:hypothetical protein